MDETTTSAPPAPTAEGVLIAWLLSAWLRGETRERRAVFAMDLMDQMDAARAAPSPDPGTLEAVNAAIPIGEAIVAQLRSSNAA